MWSWDITYLPSSVRGRFYYLYMILDVWSRMIVDWAVHASESDERAAPLAERACREHGNEAGVLTFHADNGSPIKAATMLATLQMLGVMPSFSRPRVSDDNPFSESFFRTVKYSPASPSKPFESLEAARTWVASFVGWYNCEHIHSGIRFVTPADRHTGRHEEILERGATVFAIARKSHPGRWTGAIRDLDPVPVITLHSGAGAGKEASAA